MYRFQIPSNLDVTVKQHKKYVAYCWFKQYVKGNIVLKKEVEKNRGQYWGKKLTACGWLNDLGDRWVIAPPRTVWSLMGCKRVRRHGVKHSSIKGFRYNNLFVENNLNDKNFFNSALHEIRAYLVARKINQIKQRLNTSGGVPRHQLSSQKPLFGCNAAARLLGYSTPSSDNTSSAGHKYRKKYFSVVVPPDTQAQWRENRHGVRIFGVPCYSIRLG